MFQALAICSDEGLKLETSALETLWWQIYSITQFVCLSVCLSALLCVYIHPITVFLSVAHSALSLCPFTHTSVLP